MRCIVSPKSDSVLLGLGITDQQNNVELKFESNTAKLDEITQNSRIWIKRKPNENAGGTDYTHTITSRDISTHGWFVIIECKSVKGDFPLV